MPIKGMTPEITEKTATHLEETGAQVLTLVEGAQTALVDLDWSGEDREACVNQVHEEVMQLARTIGDLLRDLAEQAQANAKQQRITSTT